MRLLVLGAGAIGGYFGARLLEAGVDVTFLVRPRRAAYLKQHGLRVQSPYGDLTLPARTIVDGIGDVYDAILLTCKAYDLNAAITAIRPSVGKETVILPLLNGLAHLQALDREFGPDAVLGGECQIGVDLTAEGTIRHLNDLHLILLGARNPAQATRADRLASALRVARFDTQMSDDIMQDVWEKFVFITTLAGITTLMRGALNEILATKDGYRLIVELLDTCACTASHYGHAPSQAFLDHIRTDLTQPESTWTSSMLRDVWRNAPTEAEHILGDMLDHADRAGVAAHLLRIALTHLRVYEIRRQSIH